MSSWNAATDYCRSHGTELASIHSEDDFNKAKTKCEEIISQNGGPGFQRGCWLGLNDVDIEGNYVWIDGTPSDYGFIDNNSSKPVIGTPWGGNQPDQGSSDHCGTLYSNVDYKWYDAPCDLTTYYPLCNEIMACWLGLKFNDTYSEWSWEDESELDYGFNSNGSANIGQDGWYKLEPRTSGDSAGSGCVNLQDQSSTNSVWNILYQNDENFELSWNNQLSTVDIMDNMYISFDIYITEYPTQTENIFQIGDTDDAAGYNDRRPGIYIHPVTGNDWILYRLSTNDGKITSSQFYSFDLSSGINLNEWYNIKVIYTQSSWYCYLNDTVIYNDTNLPNHYLFQNKKVWAAGPFEGGGQAYTLRGNISNILIMGYLDPVNSGFYWNDGNCSNIYYPICNGIGQSYVDDKYYNVWIEQPDQYIFVETKMTWNDAYLYCQNTYGTSLATIISDSDFIIATMTRYNAQYSIEYSWIGLNDKMNEGEWIWSDGITTWYDYVYPFLRCI